MENKRMYTYQFSLNNGSIQIYTCEGLFSSDNKDDESKVLINSATIIDSFMIDADGKRVIEDDAQPVSSDLEVVEQVEEVIVPRKHMPKYKKNR